MGVYGITGNAVSKINQAIEDYIKVLEQTSFVAIDRNKLNAAFKGESTQKQILNIANAIDQRSKTLARNLRNLKNDINVLNARYKKNDSSTDEMFTKTIKDIENYNVKWNTTPNMGSVTNSINKKS